MRALVSFKLRYYDSHNDLLVKGVIDLSEVESITQGLSSAHLLQQNHSHLQPNLAKKTLNGIMANSGLSGENDIKNCFELKTAKRVYYFCAKSPQEAFKWTKQLETCCLD